MNNEPGTSVPPQQSPPNPQPAGQSVPQPPPQPTVEPTVQPLPQQQPIYPPAPSAQPMMQPAAPMYGAPMAAAPAQLAQTPQPQPPTNAGTIILQWLTYAFWGWTVLAMSFLTVSVLESFINDADTGSFTPYTIAAVLVLLPISIVCDKFYSKQEPQKKTGIASVVMIIHSVIFALFGIGSLIAAAFSLITMFTSSSNTSSNMAALFSALIIFILYGAVLLRTLNPANMAWIRKSFTIFMLCVVGIISLLGLIGPVAKARETRNDKLIVDNISTVSTEINTYATNNNRLPNDLKTLSLSGDAKKLVDDNLISYTANTKPPSSFSTDSTYYSGSTYKTRSTSTYYYQLCVDFKKATKHNSPSYPDILNSDGYTTYISAYNHPAGNTCYKVQTSYY